MVEIKSNKGKLDINIKGSLIDIGADISMLIRGILDANDDELYKTIVLKSILFALKEENIEEENIDE